MAASITPNHARLEALYEVSRALTSSLDLGEALLIVIDAAIRLTGAERGFLMLYDADTGVLDFRVARTAEHEAIDESAFEVSRTVVHEVIHTGDPVVTLNAQKDPRFVDKTSIVNYLLRSIMAVPLRARGRLLGVLYVDSRTRDVVFSAGDLDLLSTFADQAATAIVNAQLFEAQKRDAEVRHVLLEIARAAQAVGTVQELAERLMAALPGWTGCERCCLFLRDAQSGRLRPAAFSRDEERTFFAQAAAFPTEPIAWVAEARQAAQPLLLPLADLIDSLPAAWLEQLRPAGDVLLVPIRAADHLLGLLTFDNPVTGQAISRLNRDVSEVLGEQLATALQRLELHEASRRQLQELAVLNAVAAAATTAGSLEELTAHVMSIINSVLGTEGLGVMLIDEAAGHLRLQTVGAADAVVVPLGQGIVGYVAATGQPRRVSNVQQDPLYLSLNAATRSELCVPLKVGERVVGVINAESLSENAFSAADERLLATVADQLAVAIEKQRLLEDERQQRQLAEALRDVGLDLTLEADLDEVLTRLLGHIARVIPYDAASVLQVTPEGLTTVVGARGYDRFGPEIEAVIPRLQFSVTDTANLRQMVETGRPHFVADVQAERTWIANRVTPLLRAWVGAPVFAQGRCVAFLSAEHSQPGAFRAEHAQRLGAFAGYAALALENVRLFQAAKQQAAELDAVRTASLSLTSSLDVRAVLNAILQSALALLPGSQDAVIYFYENNRLILGAGLRADGRPSAATEPRPHGLTYTVARLGDPVVVADMASHPLFREAPLTWRGAILGLPLKIGARVVGVMNVSYAAPRRFADGELRILKLLGEQAAAAIENARLFAATRKQVEELTFLQAVALAGTESVGLDALLERVTVMIGQLFNARHYGVLLLDQTGLVLQPHASFRGASLTPVVVGEGLVGRVATSGRSGRLPSPGAAERLRDPLHRGMRSQLAVPLKAGERVIGVIEAESEQRAAFTEDDERLLATVAGQLATAMEKARLFDAERAARGQAETLREVAALLNTTLDRAQLLGLILEQLARLVKYQSASVMLLDGDVLYLAAQRGFHGEAQYLDSIQLLGLEHIRTVLDDRQPLMIADTHSDDRWQSVPDGDYIRCWLGVPLVAKGRSIGILNLDSEQTGFYTAHDAEVALALANQAAVALERLRLLEETQQRERELSILLAIAQAVSSSLNLDEILRRVGTAVTQTLAVDSCAISAVDLTARTVALLNWHSEAPPPGEVVDGDFDLAAYPITARVIDDDDLGVVHADDMAADPAEVALLRQLGYGTLLMVAVRASGRPVGLLELYTLATDREFSDVDLRLARAIADQMGVALENARLFQAEREQRQLAEALREAATSLSASLDLDILLDQLLDRIASVVPYDAANLMLVDPFSEQAWVVRQRGYERFGPEAVATIQNVRLHISQTATLRELMEAGRAMVIADVADYPGWVDVQPLAQVRSWAGAPVLGQGNVFAFINLDKIEAGFYQPKHADRLAAFAGQVALALQNARLFEAERRRVAALTTLHDVGLELGVQLDLPSLLVSMVAGAARLLETRGGAFYALDAATEVLSIVAEHGLPAGGLPARLRVGEDIAGRVAQTEEALLVGDYAAQYGGQPARAASSVLGVPIQWQGRLLGVMTLADERPHRFSEPDVDMVRLFADQAATAIENVRLYGALEKEKQRLELLFNLSQSLASTLNPQEVALRALDLMRTASGAAKAVLYLAEPRGAALRVMRTAGYAELPAEVMAQAVPLGHGIVGFVAQQRRPLALADVRQDARWVHFPSLDEGVLSAVIVPLLAGDELIGVLSLLSDQVRFYQDEHIPLLTAAAVPVALALQNASLFESEASRVHYLTVLNEITRAAVTTEKLPALLQTMADRLGELTGADACYLTLWDEGHQRTIPVAAYGPYRGVYAQTFEPPPGSRTLTEAVLRLGHSLVVDDLHHSPHIHPDLVAGLPAQTQLVLPLIAGDQRLGAALIAFGLPHHFSPEDIQRGEQAAGQIALAIARARLFDETRRNAGELAIASDLLRRLSAVPSIPRHFPTLAADLKRLTGCGYVVMALLNDDRQSLTIVGLEEAPAEAELRVAYSDAVVADEVLTGRPVYVPDASVAGTPLDRALIKFGVGARATLPLRAGTVMIGTLALFWLEPAAYANANFTLLNQIADTLALAVEKERLLDETLRRAAELEAITAVSAALRAVATVPEILNLLVERSLALFRAETGAILMPTANADYLEYVVQRNLPTATLAQPLPLNDSIAGQVFRTGQPYRASDLSMDPVAHGPSVKTMLDTQARPWAGLYAPVRFGEDVIGVLVVSASGSRQYTPADLRLLNTIAEIGGNALQRARVLETLEQRVTERTQELARANEQLKELDRLKDQFVSNVSHELRTPLTAIKLHLGLLERRGAEVLPRYLPVLQRETERLRRLIEDLLDLSRMRARSAPLNRELHRLDTLLAEVLAVHGTRAEERHVALVHQANAAIPLVPIDAPQMVQVFTNLVANAVTYAEAGGRVTVGSRLETSGVLEGVAVFVHNQGAPIPADDLPHLFTRFYRGQTAQTSGEPGTGLGLAICKEIVERHAGYITVTSAAGEGTAFTVWLPLQTEAPPAA